MEAKEDQFRHRQAKLKLVEFGAWRGRCGKS